jgi:hypothetical protein
MNIDIYDDKWSFKNELHSIKLSTKLSIIQLYMDFSISVTYPQLKSVEFMMCCR